MSDQIMTGGSELSELRPQVWSAAFYPTLQEALPFNDSVSREYEGEIRALGNQVNITTFPQFAEALTIAEGQKSDAEGVTAVGIDLTINKQIVKDFIITDRARVQTLDAMNELRDLAFFSILKKMQSIIIDAIAPSTSAPDHTIAYDTGTTLALADILEGKELLDGSDVEQNGRVMINGAAQHNDIFNIAGLTSRDFVDGASMQNGALPGQVLGFTPRMTSEAGNTTYLFHPRFMLVAIQRDLSVMVYDQGAQGLRSMRVNTSLLMGLVQASNLRVVTIG